MRCGLIAPPLASPSVHTAQEKDLHPVSNVLSAGPPVPLTWGVRPSRGRRHPPLPFFVQHCCRRRCPGYAQREKATRGGPRPEVFPVPPALPRPRLALLRVESPGDHACIGFPVGAERLLPGEAGGGGGGCPAPPSALPSSLPPLPKQPLPGLERGGGVSTPGDGTSANSTPLAADNALATLPHRSVCRQRGCHRLWVQHPLSPRNHPTRVDPQHVAFHLLQLPRALGAYLHSAHAPFAKPCGGPHGPCQEPSRHHLPMELLHTCSARPPVDGAHLPTKCVRAARLE